MFGFLKGMFGNGAAPKARPLTERERAVQQIQAKAKNVMTPARAELIKNAMAVHKAKQTILAELSDENRAKLVLLALRMLMNEPPPKPVQPEVQKAPVKAKKPVSEPKKK